MGEVLARSPALSCQELAGTLFLAVWREFSSPFHQQELVSCLIAQIAASTVSTVSTVSPMAGGGGSESPAVTVSLHVLETLAASPAPNDLSRFSLFIRGLLDFADRLSVAQADSLLGVLCRLASESRESGNSFDELFILVRKYLQMSDAGHKKMGVLGCCAVLRFSRGDPESAKNLFAFAGKATRNFPEIRLFFYERLTAGIEAGQIRGEVLEVREPRG